MKQLKISAPGRVCLFGEHQDYLQLPAIACAISLRISIKGEKRKDKYVNINLPDINGKESFSLEGKLEYKKERDYFRSAVNVMRRHNAEFNSGFDCTVESNIPINAGTASSSALVVAWISFLAGMSSRNLTLTAEDIARYAHEAEVLEFSEPGGKMDHYSSAFGGIILMSFFPGLTVQTVDTDLYSFVLGDSKESKDTKYVLSTVKNKILNLTKKLEVESAGFSLQKVQEGDLTSFSTLLAEEELKLLEGTLLNRDITKTARNELTKKNIDHHYIGQLLNEHHRVLRDVLKISTPKIDGMIKASLDAGAYGAKINGSGGGGCMFAYAPEDPEKVRCAVEKAGGVGYIIAKDSGIRIENGD